MTRARMEGKSQTLQNPSGKITNGGDAMTACEHCGQADSRETTRVGRLCRHCHAHWLARGELPPPSRHLGWPFEDPPKPDE